MHSPPSSSFAVLSVVLNGPLGSMEEKSALDPVVVKECFEQGPSLLS